MPIARIRLEAVMKLSSCFLSMNVSGMRDDISHEYQIPYNAKELSRWYSDTLAPVIYPVETGGTPNHCSVAEQSRRLELPATTVRRIFESPGLIKLKRRRILSQPMELRMFEKKEASRAKSLEVPRRELSAQPKASTSCTFPPRP